MPFSRRGFIASAVGATSLLVGEPGARAQTPMAGPGEPEYAKATERGYNSRFVARPERVYLPVDAEEVRAAVAAAVRAGLRPAARSGGHCFDDFVDSADTRALIDLGRMTGVEWDERHRAFSVGAGTELRGL
ncbi:FAD-binding protein [Nocardia sp. XZ_19_385]|uniref:FAD-binding protein n=1 Tax=Nocardia sp. XZ_19_385 TaxID=2769488 RepID=UPI001E3F9A2A|nr:FAD-binding protein [Nocardia sp. XZ_19_385]